MSPAPGSTGHLGAGRPGDIETRPKGGPAAVPTERGRQRQLHVQHSECDSVYQHLPGDVTTR